LHRTENLEKEKQGHAEQARKMRAVLNATTDLALLIGGDGIVLDINDNTATVLGDRAEPLIGRNIEDVFSGYCGALMKSKNETVISLGDAVNFEHTAFERIFDVRIFPVIGDDRRVTATAVFCRDISREKQLERQLLLAQKLEAVGQLASGIVHEINTPIQYVSNNIQFLKDAFEDFLQLLTSYRAWIDARPVVSSGNVEGIASPDEAEEKVDYAYLREAVPEAFCAVQEGIVRVTDIVKAMKNYAHSGAGNALPSDLNKALTDAVTIARSVYKNAADVQVDLGPLPPVTCHLSNISQVFLNLIVNAAHAVEDAAGKDGKRGLIRIESRLEGDTAVIRFSDTGCGIPKSIRERIFDPFFTTKKIGRGSGQGLAIAHSVIVDKHGGSIDLESEPGVGTVFRICLPVKGPKR
jgi:two-component system, NtrC family, sensor kinase